MMAWIFWPISRYGLCMAVMAACTAVSPLVLSGLGWFLFGFSIKEAASLFCLFCGLISLPISGLCEFINFFMTFVRVLIGCLSGFWW
jgi:hypothetical protein